MRFSILDVDKNGVADTADLAIVARNLAAYRNQGSDEEKHYFKVITSTSLVDETGVIMYNHNLKIKCTKMQTLLVLLLL